MKLLFTLLSIFFLFSNISKSDESLVKKSTNSKVMENSDSNKPIDKHIAVLTEFEESLVGVWKNSPILSPKNPATYSFFPNKKIILHFESSCDSRVISKIGIWGIKNSKLEIVYFEKEHIIGGKLVKAGATCDTKNKIKGGKIVISRINKLRPFEYTISEKIEIDNENKKYKILIDEKSFWKYSDDPKEFN